MCCNSFETLCQSIIPYKGQLLQAVVCVAKWQIMFSLPDPVVASSEGYVGDVGVYKHKTDAGTTEEP